MTSLGVGPKSPLPPLPKDLERHEFILPEDLVRHGHKKEHLARSSNGNAQGSVNNPRGIAMALQSQRHQHQFRAPLRELNPRQTAVLQKDPKQKSMPSPGFQERIENERLGDLTFGESDSKNDLGVIHGSEKSMKLTPFGIDDLPRPKLSLATNLRLQENEFRLTPIEVDLGVLAAIASVPDSRHPARKLSSVQDHMPSASAQDPTGRKPSVSTFELPSGSIINVITPEQSAWQRTIYLPGTIRIEGRLSCRISSVLSPLNMFIERYEQSPSTQDSEETVMSEIAEFFEEFGTGFQSNNLSTGLDAFRKTFSTVKDQFSYSTAEWPKPDRASRKRFTSLMNDLPRTLSSSGERGYSDSTLRDSLQSTKRAPDHRSTFPFPVASEAMKTKPRSQAIPSSPNPSPPLPITPESGNQIDFRKGRKSTGSSGHKISLRRLLHSAGSIV